MVDDASPFIGIDVRHDDGREVIALVGDLDLGNMTARVSVEICEPLNREER
jgi:hypothetical protein